MNTTREDFIERLKQILIYNEFYEAALEINEICRGCSTKMISDKVESWRNYAIGRRKNGTL